MKISAVRFLRSGRLRSTALGCCLFSASLLPSQKLTVIGGTGPQQQLTACIEQLSTKDLEKLPGADHSMTIVILEREKFLQVKDSFGAHLTRLAFSNPQTRRIYLSSDVFLDFDTTLRCIPHELGHLVTGSFYEVQAEIAARQIRKRAQEICTMPLRPDPRRALSSELKKLAGPITE
jgi:hypothetical protein